MTNVTARKIRDHGRERAAVGVGRVYNGFLVSYPVVGRGMVIFRDPNGHRMITTPVRRILGEPENETVYVETENSVYRLTFHTERQADRTSPREAVAGASSPVAIPPTADIPLDAAQATSSVSQSHKD